MKLNSVVLGRIDRIELLNQSVVCKGCYSDETENVEGAGEISWDESDSASIEGLDRSVHVSGDIISVMEWLRKRLTGKNK